MWIKSQDKKTLVNVKNVSSIGIFADDAVGTICIGVTVDESALDLGFYNTEQEAMRVLDEIETYVAYAGVNVYKMPSREESKLWGGEDHGNYDSDTK